MAISRWPFFRVTVTVQRRTTCRAPCVTCTGTPRVHTRCRSKHSAPCTPSCPRAGCFLNTLGLVFLGVSHTSDGVNLLHPGAILIGLGGITFHLAQVCTHITTTQPMPAAQCVQAVSPAILRHSEACCVVLTHA